MASLQEQRATAEASSKKKLTGLYIGLGALMVLLILFACVLPLMSASKPPLEPTTWKQVETTTQELSLEVPANWHFVTSGASGVSEWALIQGGRLCHVTIHGDTQVLGAIGDTSSAAARSMDQGEGQLDVTQRGEGGLHAFVGMMLAKEDRQFKEEAEVHESTFGGKPAAYSDFTTRRRVGVMGVTVKGRRMSVPAGDYGYDIRAECPAQHWEKFEPVATRILESVKMRGQT